MSALLLTSHASTKYHELMTNDYQCSDFNDWNKTDFRRLNCIVSFEVATVQRVAAAVSPCRVEGETYYEINLRNYHLVA